MSESTPTESESSPTQPLLTVSAQYTPRNRGPITTLFDPPKSCLATPTLGAQQRIFYFGHQSQKNYFDPSCFPTGTISPESLQDANWGLYYYSPAICPKGWNHVRTYARKLEGNTEDIAIGKGTTAALCCPPGYTSVTSAGHGQKCSSRFTQDQVVTYIFPTLNGPNSWILPTSSSTYAAPAKPSVVYGDGVIVMWQKTDEALLVEAAKETTQTLTNTPLLSTSGGLSTGAKAGIGVGAAIVVLVALMIGWLVLRRRRRDRESLDVPPVARELDAGSNIVEAAPGEPRKELYTQVREPVHELPT